MASPNKHHRSSKFLGIHGILSAVYPKIHTGSPTPAEVTLGENAGKKKAAIQWNDRCQQAFNDLKSLCTTTPILAYADFTQPFMLHTNACGSGLGDALYQTCKNGMDAGIAYTGRSLTKAKCHYPIHKLEFPTLK